MLASTRRHKIRICGVSVGRAGRQNGFARRSGTQSVIFNSYAFHTAVELERDRTRRYGVGRIYGGARRSGRATDLDVGVGSEVEEGNAVRAIQGLNVRGARINPEVERTNAAGGCRD